MNSRSPHMSKDRLDLEALEATVETLGYRLIAEKIANTIRQTELKLHTCTPDDLRPLQREIQTLELVLRMPKMITAEITKRCP